jgi:hypothetical protein
LGFLGAEIISDFTFCQHAWVLLGCHS